MNMGHAVRAGEGCTVAGCSMSPAIAAAAALLEDPATSEPDSPSEAGSTALSGGGCIVMVTFQFLHRAEWLQAGARLILRDRGGSCIAGAGVVRAVLYEI